MNSVIVNSTDCGVILKWENTNYIITCAHCVTHSYAIVTHKHGLIEDCKCLILDKEKDIAILNTRNQSASGSPLATEFKIVDVALYHNFPTPFSIAFGSTLSVDGLHNCHTEWGSSGAPLFDIETESIVGIHESYDDYTLDRYCVTCDTIRQVIEDEIEKKLF